MSTWRRHSLDPIAEIDLLGEPLDLLEDPLRFLVASGPTRESGPGRLDDALDIDDSDSLCRAC